MTRAVVVGTGLAGLLGAAVLAEHADEVHLVERDRPPDAAEPRKGVPQGRHTHVLLHRGQLAIDELLPGFVVDLAARGAPAVDFPADAAVRSLWGWLQRCPSGRVSRPATRGLVEQLVRRRVLALPNVVTHDGVEVVGLGSRGSTVTGIVARRRGTPGGTVELNADLVLDASGRESHLLRWLAALGLPAPPETVVDASLGYASRLYTRTDDTSRDWAVLVARDDWPSTRGVAFLPVEGQRWSVTLSGSGRREQPPTDPAEFGRHARQIAGGAARATLDGAEPLGPVAGYLRTANRWRHVDRMPGWPAGLAAAGDAVCSFNPVYGQGMTVAALEALTLRDLLAADGLHPQLGQRLNTAVARLLRDPWLMATGEDYRWPDTRGPRRGVRVRLGHVWTDRVMRAACHDPAVALRFMEVIHMMRPIAALLRPAFVARVLAAQ